MVLTTVVFLEAAASYRDGPRERQKNNTSISALLFTVSTFFTIPVNEGSFQASRGFCAESVHYQVFTEVL